MQTWYRDVSRIALRASIYYAGRIAEAVSFPSSLSAPTEILPPRHLQRYRSRFATVHYSLYGQINGNHVSLLHVGMPYDSVHSIVRNDALADRSSKYPDPPLADTRQIRGKRNARTPSLPALESPIYHVGLAPGRRSRKSLSM